MESITFMENVLEGIQKQDSEALNKAMELYGDKLLKVASVYLKDDNLACDIVQKVFIKLYNRIDQFENRSSLYTWLYRITINECKSELRSWNFRNIFYTNKLPTRKSDQNIEQNVLDKETRVELYQQILKLDIKYRMVIHFYYYEDLSIKEISSILETNENTIKTRLYRGRKKLKEFLTAKEGGSYER